MHKLISTLSFLFIIGQLPAQDMGRLSSSFQKGLNSWTHSLKKRIRFQKKKKLLKPGKIYHLGSTLYVNDQNRGLHLIDNSQPRHPKFKEFIKIPGNYDVAIKGNILFADNFEDLAIINLITKEVKRIPNVFPASYKHFQSTKTNAMQQQAQRQQVAQAGSMARFGIYKDYLYVLDENRMKIFNINDWRQVRQVHEMKVDFRVETIFNYADLLFVGGEAGVYIFDLKEAARPQLKDIFVHALACDPVVVDDHTAYITLRSNSRCRDAGTNQLDVVDVRNPSKAKRLHSMTVKQALGLAVHKQHLYLCNDHHIELYEIAADKSIQLKDKMMVKGAYDALYLADRKLLLVVAEAGVYQFAVHQQHLKLLSILRTSQPINFSTEDLQNLSLGMMNY